MVQLIKFAKISGYRSAQIITNAVLLADEKLVGKILKMNSGQDFKVGLCVSLHSHRKKISERLVCVPNTFEKTLKGIENLIDYGCQNVYLYHLINKYNYKDLPEFVSFIHKGFPQIKFIAFSFIFPSGAVLKNKYLIPKLSNVKPYLSRALGLCKKYKINFIFSNCGLVPFCCIKGSAKYFINHQKFDQGGERWTIDSRQNRAYYLSTKKFREEGDHLLKIQECSRCIFNDLCPGLWKVYAELYGTDELRPMIKPD